MPKGLSRWWRRFNRSPYIRDLRAIQIEHRHLYRERMEKGTCGHALQALYHAYLAKHLISQRVSHPSGRESGGM